MYEWVFLLLTTSCAYRVPVFGKENLFGSRNTRQYLYHISPQIPNPVVGGGTKVCYIHVYIHTYMHTYICIHAHIHTCIHTCMFGFVPLLLCCAVVRGQAASVSVGKMDIVWRTQFGERGRIQTGQLKAIVSGPSDLCFCYVCVCVCLIPSDSDVEIHYFLVFFYLMRWFDKLHNV